ncbi:hypothetical protein ACHAQH_002248 [Verticillium albo-atrum]
MCIEDRSYCAHCGFQRTMYFQRCRHWIKELERYYRAYPSNCLSNAQYPKAQDCKQLSRNLRMAIRPGACPRGPPKNTTVGNYNNEASVADSDATLVDENGGCPGYEVKAELKSMGHEQWEKAWGHHAVRWEMGMQQMDFMAKRADDMPGAMEALTRKREDVSILARELEKMRRAQDVKAQPTSTCASSPAMSLVKKIQTTQAVVAENVMGQIGERRSRRVRWAGYSQKIPKKPEVEPKDQFPEDLIASSDQVAALGIKIRTLLVMHTSYIDSEKGRIGKMMDEHIDKQRELAIQRPTGARRVRHFNGPLERPAPTRRRDRDEEAPMILACALHEKEAVRRDMHNVRRDFGGGLLKPSG